MINENSPNAVRNLIQAIFLPTKTNLLKFSTRKILAGILTISFFLASATSTTVLALPAGYIVESGEVTFDTSEANTLVITASDRAIINFDSFSIAQNESVRFIQPLDSASVLGRVTGGEHTDIF